MNLDHGQLISAAVAVLGLPVFASLVLALDLWLFVRFGEEATISRITLEASKRHPILIVAVPSTLCLWVGLLIGHMLLPMRD